MILFLKKVLQIALFLLIGFIIVYFAKDKQNEKNLVAYYPFNGNANDESGNRNNCKIVGASLANDRFQRKDSALYFDGVSNMLFADVKNLFELSSPHTISWWYKIDTIQTYTDINGAGNMWALVNADGGVGVQSGFRAPAYKTLGLDVWLWGGATLLQTNIPDVKLWHHCVYTFDSTIQRFYIDGKEVAKAKVSVRKGIVKQIMFGNYPDGDQYFKGNLDDVRIYNKALLPKEVENLFNAKS